MKKENSDDKLTSFLRANKPDIPKASPEFEERLLNVTVRQSWRHRFNAFFKHKWRYAFSASFAVLLILVAMIRQNEPSHRINTPMVAATQTAAADLNDEDVYSFLVESWNGVQGNHNTDFLAELDAI